MLKKTKEITATYGDRVRGSVVWIPFSIFAKVDFQNVVVKRIFKCKSIELKTDLTKRPCYFVEPSIYIFLLLMEHFFTRA